MKRAILILALAAGGLAACEPPVSDDYETAEMPAEAPVAPAAEDVAAPAAAPSATDTPPVDPSTLPPEKRTSEQSVQPESETLFY